VWTREQVQLPSSNLVAEDISIETNSIVTCSDLCGVTLKRSRALAMAAAAAATACYCYCIAGTSLWRWPDCNFDRG